MARVHRFATLASSTLRSNVQRVKPIHTVVFVALRGAQREWRDAPATPRFAGSFRAKDPGTRLASRHRMSDIALLLALIDTSTNTTVPDLARADHERRESKHAHYDETGEASAGLVDAGDSRRAASARLLRDTRKFPRETEVCDSSTNGKLALSSHNEQAPNAGSVDDRGTARTPPANDAVFSLRGSVGAGVGHVGFGGTWSHSGEAWILPWVGAGGFTTFAWEEELFGGRGLTQVGAGPRLALRTTGRHWLYLAVGGGPAWYQLEEHETCPLLDLWGTSEPCSPRVLSQRSGTTVMGELQGGALFHVGRFEIGPLLSLDVSSESALGTLQLALGYAHPRQ
jgi:hypothetical protein